MVKPHIRSFLCHGRLIADVNVVGNVFVNEFVNLFVNVFDDVFGNVFVNVYGNVFGKALFAPFFPTVSQYQRQCHQLPMSVSMSSLITSRQPTHCLATLHNLQNIFVLIMKFICPNY